MATVNTAWDHVSSNIFKTWLIMILFGLFTFGVLYIFGQFFFGGDVGGLGILGGMFLVIGFINFFAYFNSDSMLLSMAGAKQIQKHDHPELFRIVENLSIAGGLPTPKIYIIDDSATNAFATGRDPKHASIAFTSGILEKLNKQELEGVAAHELSHVGNRDTLLMSVVSILVGTIALVADFFTHSLWFRDNDSDSRGSIIILGAAVIAAILAPIIATLIQLAVSRRREYLADASGVLLTRHPGGLASALAKISSDREPLEVANRGTAHLYIVNPLKGDAAKAFFSNLFNTHPPIKERIKRLQEMEGKV